MNTHLLALYLAAVFVAMIAPGPDARQALDAGSGTIMVALAGRLALER